VVIGTAGHIDHGKTSIVKALTGTDTDSLKEEKKRGMTIDIGFAYLNDQVTIIDVPGHEKFIRNMVSGVSTINIALIVVSADDGLMPQTHEHIEILNLLNVKDAIFALSKIDKVDNNKLNILEESIRKRIKNTNFKNAKILRTSVINGMGIDNLKEEILTQSAQFKKNQDNGMFYMPIDRVFSKKGFGTIATGTVLSGKLEKNSEVEIFPGRIIANVRSFQTHGNEVRFVKNGDRAAINLSNIEHTSLKRGYVLAEKSRLAQTSKVIANIKMIKASNWKIANKQLIHIHIGTSQVVAKAITYRKEILAGESANILLDLSQPIAPLNEQKFIIRSISPMETIAGGTILESNPQYTKKELKENIQNIKVDSSKRFFQLVQRNWKSPASIKQWSENFNKTEEQVQLWVDVFEMISTEELIFTSDSLKKSKQLIFEKIENYHRNNIYKKNFPKEDLLSQTGFTKKWFDYVVKNMGDEIIFKDGGYSLASNQVKLSNEDSIIANQIEIFLLEAKFNLQSPVKVYPQNKKKALNILYLLRENGLTVQVNNDLWMHRNCYEILKSNLRLYFKKNNKLSVPDFKGILNVTRKNAIPLLEYLDKINFTKRVENYRIEGASLND